MAKILETYFQKDVLEELKRVAKMRCGCTPCTLFKQSFEEHYGKNEFETFLKKINLKYNLKTKN